MAIEIDRWKKEREIKIGSVYIKRKGKDEREREKERDGVILTG